MLVLFSFTYKELEDCQYNVHMDQILGNYQPVISHQTFTCGRDSFLAVGC